MKKKTKKVQKVKATVNKAFKDKIKKKAQVWLNLGCGVWLRRKFINVDNSFTEEKVRSKEGSAVNAVIEKGAKFVQADIKKLPFPNNFADYVELMNTIEHFPMYRMVEYVKEIYRVMKKGAKLVIMTNSFDGLAVDWLQMQTQGRFDINNYYSVAETIYGNQYGDSEGEVHRCPFTKEFLNYILFAGGFKKGEMFIIPKGAPIPQVGTYSAVKGKVARNDLLIAEITK